MNNQNEPDEFLSEYKEWLSHIDNPYYYAGTISDFELRALRDKKRKKYKRSEGLPFLIGGLLSAIIMVAISWSMITSEDNYLILFFSIPFFIFSLLFFWRGISIVIGIAPDIEAVDESK